MPKALTDRFADVFHARRSEPHAGVGSSRQRLNAKKAFEEFVGSPDYPCVGAKAALQRDAYRFGFYQHLGEFDAANDCVADLQHFGTISDQLDPEFATFVAIFAGPQEINERVFSLELWRHLSLMARIDQRDYEWDAGYSSDPENPEFAMSVGGRAFYVIGLHPGASRMARQFPHCALVFNAHHQFEALKNKGTYTGIRDNIRDRDEALQGDVNPMVEDHGLRSEALQYDGASHLEGWQPSFSPQTTSEGKCPLAGIPGVTSE